MKRWKIITAVAFLFGMAGFVFAWKEYNRKNPDTNDLRPVMHLEALSLLKDFEANEIQANKQYNDKVLSVQGRVVRIEKNGNTENVVLGDESSLNGVICEFQPEHKNQVSKLVPGQQINIKGICTGILLDVVLVRCVLN